MPLDKFSAIDNLTNPKNELLIERSNLFEGKSYKYIYSDDLIENNKSNELLPKGIIVKPLFQAIREHEEILKPIILEQATHNNSNKYIAYLFANLARGLVVIAEDGAVLEDPIELYYWHLGDAKISTAYTIICAGKNSKVDVLEYNLSDNVRSGMSFSASYLNAGINSRVTYSRCQLLNEEINSLHYSSESLEKGAKTNSLVVNIGSKVSRSESICKIKDKDANAEILSLNIVGSNQEHDQRTLQIHEGAGSKSDLLFKNVIYGKGHAIFSGLINVMEGAHETDAYQTCRNLLMSDNAEADSMPGLEINADQVKCSHGSTTGQVDQEELFYFLTRGITKNIAQLLIAQGFTNEVIQKFNKPKYEEHIKSLITNKLLQLAEIESSFLVC